MFSCIKVKSIFITIMIQSFGSLPFLLRSPSFTPFLSTLPTCLCPSVNCAFSDAFVFSVSFLFPAFHDLLFYFERHIKISKHSYQMQIPLSP